MNKVNDKLLNFASIIDDNTLNQAIKSSTMSFIKPYIALMPDAHLGMGATVGSVIPTVGVDIGCGMIAVRTQFTADQILQKDRKILRNMIERTIPLSAGKSNSKVFDSAKGRIQELEIMAGERLEFYGHLTKIDWEATTRYIRLRESFH